MTKPRDEKRFDRQWDQWRRHVGSPRRERDRWVPSDELDARHHSLWFWSPYSMTDPPTEKQIAEWPAQRREILLESHAAVMESFARYGPLP